MKKLSLSAFIFGIATIVFEYYDRRFLWFLKPATLLLIISLLILYGAKRDSYRRMILAGLFFSLAGDMFLIDSQNYFIYGLGSFFFAHLFYIAAFFSVRIGFDLRSLGAFGVGILILVMVYAGVPEGLKIPVAVYSLAISTMLCLAVNYWLTCRTRKSLTAVCGAILFVASDSIIAVNKFSFPFHAARFCILITYFAAQWLIARSTEAGSEPFITRAGERKVTFKREY